MRRLLDSERDGVLATLSARHGGCPFASLVQFATGQAGEPLLLLSELAEHTRNLRADPRASLLVRDSGAAAGDALAGARVTLIGRAELLVGDAQPVRDGSESQHAQGAVRDGSESQHALDASVTRPAHDASDAQPTQVASDAQPAQTGARDASRAGDVGDLSTALERYFARHPQARAYLAMPDFHLWVLHVQEARVVGGFGDMGWLTGDALRTALTQ